MICFPDFSSGVVEKSPNPSHHSRLAVPFRMYFVKKKDGWNLVGAARYVPLRGVLQDRPWMVGVGPQTPPPPHRAVLFPPQGIVGVASVRWICYFKQKSTECILLSVHEPGGAGEAG